MATPSATGPISIPVVDVRDGGPVRHAAVGRQRARALGDQCVGWLPRTAVRLLPAIDLMTRRWLLKSHSPFVREIQVIATDLGIPGVWFLNGCYQWGCTALAREQDGMPWLVRTLDWPFPGLGRHLEVARMRGAAGDFDNVTWPGYVGVLTASGPRTLCRLHQSSAHAPTDPVAVAAPLRHGRECASSSEDPEYSAGSPPPGGV